MSDSWEEVLDWERWAREVLTAWRVPFDNHKVGLRLGITQQLCDLRDERDCLAAQCLELRERAAFLESREVCTVAHDNVETCGYCQRDAIAKRLAQWERAAQQGHPTPCTLGPLCPYCEIDRVQARLADTEAQLERESALLTEAKCQNADLMAIIDKRDEALGFIPLDKGMDMMDELREAKARLTEAERLLLLACQVPEMPLSVRERINVLLGLADSAPSQALRDQARECGCGICDACAAVEAARLTVSASAVQPERCCLDYPRCDCNSPPEPDNAPTLQPCGHPWKAQHDFKCILCSSPGVTP